MNSFIFNGELRAVGGVCRGYGFESTFEIINKIADVACVEWDVYRAGYSELDAFKNQCIESGLI